MEFQLEADRTDLRRGERRGSGLLSGGRDGRQWTIGNDKCVIGGHPAPSRSGPAAQGRPRVGAGATDDRPSSISIVTRASDNGTNK